MELITGGRYQGKKEFAETGLGVSNENIISDFNETVKKLLEEGRDPYKYVEDIIKNRPDAVVIADEVGCGIIPADEKEREYRQIAGRLVCILSENSEHVYRVVAGLGIKLK